MSTKLYPPQIAGSLPAFCKTYDILQDLSTGARITIPFIMNAGVGEAEVKGFALRIKTASSNTYICPVLYSVDWDRDKNTVTFEIKEEYANNFNEGQFYKVQLAYYNYETTAVLNPLTGKYEETVMDVVNADNFVIGYYSTVGIIKCISKPKIFIEGYSSNNVNLFNGSFLGICDQKDSLDKTEKVYSYRFDFYDIEDNLVHTSGELIHNINNDNEQDYSIDRYTCNDFIKPAEVYKLVYTVVTSNGYVGTSPRYKVTANTRLAPGRYMEIVPTPIVEQGCIDVSCKGELALSPHGIMEEALYYGEFLLSRASEEDGYVEWEQIQEFRLSNQKPSTFHFYDFSVKQGVKYIYAVQQFNMSKLYSARMLSEPVSIDFEDMFLFDGERCLKIRFNPKVSSFKTTHLEKKIETIGSKYPFVFRNGAVGYKEFSVEGLISYHMDENQNFFTRKELYDFYRQNEETKKKHLNQKYIENHRDTDLTEANILLERQFKIAVLDWLNNGEPKLFKSATEGNFIVRLLNISLTPEDTLGRMLHTFKSTAIEIADCTLANLKKYGFSIGGAISSYVPLWRTYSFTSLDNSPDGRGKELKFEQEVTSFRIEGVLPGTKFYIYYSDSPIPEEIIIGSTGAYSFSGSYRRVIKLLFMFENNLNIQGSIECEYIGRRYSNFDAITDIKLQTIISNQVIGINPSLQYMANSTELVENWNLAVNALVDTNYRTYFNNYLMHTYIDQYLKKEITNIPYTNPQDWVDLLKRLDILEEQINHDGTKKLVKKANSSFDPSDTIQYIKTDFYNYERNKLNILNMEQAKLRQREIVPVYVVPYEMITPEAWDKMPNEVSGKSKVAGTNYFTKEDYEWDQFLTTKLLFSTTPFGKPYPIDELITYLTLQVNNYEPMIDKYYIYIIYKYNREKAEWELINNKSDVAPVFSGHYYDPHHKQLLQSYETTFYINDKYRFDPINKHDIVKQDIYNVLKADNQTILTNDMIYIKEDGKYILATEKFNYPSRYDLWISVKEPDIYYIKSINNIDLQYSKEMTFEQLGEVNSFGISNGIISEQTFQLQITDYYTEVNDFQTAQAKADYLKASNFLKDVFKMFHNIEQLDTKQIKYQSLFKLYEVFLKGADAPNYEYDKYPLNAYDFLLLYIMLEKEYMEIDIIEQYILTRLTYAGSLVEDDIVNNLRRLVSDYRGTIGVPINILLEEMFYTENEDLKPGYNNKKNVYTIIYNQLSKYSELKLIESEESDLLSLFTDEKITGLDSKNQSLKKMHDLIAAEINAKQLEAEELEHDFLEAQQNVYQAYEEYNNNLGKTAVVEWIKELVRLNTPTDPEQLKTFKLLDLLTNIEQFYTAEANNLNVESQYQQEQIDKWKNYYKTNYTKSSEIKGENTVLLKIKNDNEDDADLDNYLQSSIDKNLKEIIILLAQMEQIENTPYNGVQIFTEEELESFSGKQIDIENKSMYETVCEQLIINQLENLQQEIDDAGINDIEKIEEDDEKLIDLIQNFVIEADNLQLFREFKNFGNNIIFNITENYDSIRDSYIQKLPPSVIIILKRNVLKINTSGNVLAGSINNTGEYMYLFTNKTTTPKEIEFYNIKEYKNRVMLVLQMVRVLMKNITAGSDIESIIKVTPETRDFDVSNYLGKISNASIDTINTAIKEINRIITKYVGLLHNSALITSQKWTELIDSFNEIHSFDQTIAAEPGDNSLYSSVNYKNKINNGKDLNTTATSKTYNIEDYITVDNDTQTADGNNTESYHFRGHEIYTVEKKTTEYSYTAPYRYFSDFYWRLIGDLGTDNKTGMLWWYLDIVLQGEIAYQKSVLEDMKVLLKEYETKLDNYNEKLNRYKEEYENSEKLFKQYEIEYPEVFNYYFSNTGDQYELIDNAIADTKKYWNLFILELDLGYKREVERGMYG